MTINEDTARQARERRGQLKSLLARSLGEAFSGALGTDHPAPAPCTSTG